jgi:STE24 endopeptidase
MKNLPWIGITLLAFLVISTQLPPNEDVVNQAKPYFSDEVINQGQTFAFQRRWIFWANALAQLALLVYLVYTPLGKRLYLKTGAWVQSHWFAHLVLLGGIYFLASAAVGFPFKASLYFLNAQWGMANQSFFGWLGDHLLGLLVTAIFEGIVLLGFYAIVRNVPNNWWLAAGGAGIVFGFISAFIYPDVVEPLFNTFTPIAQTSWRNSEVRIVNLGASVGAKAANVYVVDASRQSNARNAYYTGFGSSQRIVLYDTLLENHSADEVDIILAHEIGHWWHQHIWQGILIGGLFLTGGLYLLSRYLERLVAGGTLRNPGDPAGIFRVILLSQLAVAVTLPIHNGISRMMERHADEIALHLTRRPDVFIAVEKKLAISNKSNVAPLPWNVLLFASHPPAVERIRYAEEWTKEQTKKDAAK